MGHTHTHNTHAQNKITTHIFFFLSLVTRRYFSSKEQFGNLVEAAKRLEGAKWAIGGNAPVMAQRFAMEGCTVLLGSLGTQQMAEKLHPSVQLPRTSRRKAKEDDIHLVLEYSAGSTWGRYTSPRANRFIVHNDHSNLMMESLPPFASSLKDFNPTLVVVGGLQLLDNFPLEESLRREKLKQLQGLLASLPPSTRVHFEMASITEEQFLRDILDIVVPYVDSLGMNEQELANLCSFIQHDQVKNIAHSNPRVATALDQTRALFDGLSARNASTEPELASSDKGRRSVSRIHVHTLAFQAILVKKGSSWRNLHGAVAKASLTANRHVCASDTVDTGLAQIILDDSFSISLKSGSSRMILTETAPISCWHEEKVRFCVAPNLVCTQVHQTAGGGDNISAAGLVPQL